MLGGDDQTGHRTRSVLNCSIPELLQSWEAMGDMLTARCWALVAIFNGKITVVGGDVEGRWDWIATDVVERLC